VEILEGPEEVVEHLTGHVFRKVLFAHKVNSYVNGVPRTLLQLQSLAAFEGDHRVSLDHKLVFQPLKDIMFHFEEPQAKLVFLLPDVFDVLHLFENKFLPVLVACKNLTKAAIT
jgi:hypothetical protein